MTEELQSSSGLGDLGRELAEDSNARFMHWVRGFKPLLPTVSRHQGGVQAGTKHAASPHGGRQHPYRAMALLGARCRAMS